VLKERFRKLLKVVDPQEIAMVEQKLISEGLPEEDIKNLCDVHVEVFKESLDKQKPPQSIPGHPIHTFLMENKEIEKFLKKIEELTKNLGETTDSSKSKEIQKELLKILDEFSEIELHYSRIENQLFPYLEKKGITGPPTVMWAIHDDIRALLKKSKKYLKEQDLENFISTIKKMNKTIADMNYKEEKILYPICLDNLTESDWIQMKDGEKEIGYAWIVPGNDWKPIRPKDIHETKNVMEGLSNMENLELDVGKLSLEQINLILKHLPVDLTFIDETDSVKYFSQGKERIFPRSPGIIGRKVQNCHPKKSVHKVTKILESFKAGTKDVAEFWINVGEKYVYIRYFAVRDSKGEYKGTLEVSQDIKSIQDIKGERRILDWES
ncbi:MAG: DUF438 domain-containing protein, partial [Candidatus Helarchaeota archaeon]